MKFSLSFAAMLIRNLFAISLSILDYTYHLYYGKEKNF